jgi:hypothetical protein
MGIVFHLGHDYHHLQQTYFAPWQTVDAVAGTEQ